MMIASSFYTISAYKWFDKKILLVNDGGNICHIVFYDHFMDSIENKLE